MTIGHWHVQHAVIWHWYYLLRDCMYFSVSLWCLYMNFRIVFLTWYWKDRRSTIPSHPSFVSYCTWGRRATIPSPPSFMNYCTWRRRSTIPSPPSCMSYCTWGQLVSRGLLFWNVCVIIVKYVYMFYLYAWIEFWGLPWVEFYIWGAF